MTKPSLYALYSWKYQIDQGSGDCINELRTLRTLSSVFDIYYNNDKFDASKTLLGNKNDRGPAGDYDYYYIRSNKEVFSKISGPKISFAYPYNEEVFNQSAALIVLTENWKQHLRQEHAESREKLRAVYGVDMSEIDCPVINVGQPYDEGLKAAVSHDVEKFQMTSQTLGASVFGYYGNLNHELYPYNAFEAIASLNDQHPNCFAMAVLAGKFRQNSFISGRHILHIGSIPYNKMHALHDITIANLTNESDLNHCLGNQKVIDSIARGVPVVCKKFDTFVWQLGYNYLGLYETADEAREIFLKLLYDQDFRNNLVEQSRKRADFFSPDNVIERFLAQPELSELLGSGI